MKPDSPSSISIARIKSDIAILNLGHPYWPSKPASQPVYHEGFVLQYQIDKQLASTSCPTLKYVPRQSVNEVLDVAKAQQVDSSLATTKASCAHKASRSIVVNTVERIDLDPKRTIFDPSPPFQRLSSDRYFKNTKFVTVDDDSEGHRSKKQKLGQENLNTPPASPSNSTIVVDLFPSKREHVQDKRDKRDEDAFRKLETKYATRFDRWFRQVLDRASHANPNAYGYFSRELLKMPTYVSYYWLAATENNDVAREQCIIRLHELIYGLLARIRDEHHDDAEYFSSEESESASDDGADPTLRFRAPLNGEGAWKEMHKFWRMLNSAQGMYSKAIFGAAHTFVDRCYRC